MNDSAVLQIYKSCMRAHSNASECIPTEMSTQSPRIYQISGSQDATESLQSCAMDDDGILCWPEIAAGETASLPCFAQLCGINYNTSGIVSRICKENGTWDKTDYSNCLHLHPNSTADNSLDITTGVYFCGYSFSLVALLAASIIFVAFKELRCLRNRIHFHLIITYIVADSLWILSFVMGITSYQSTQAACVTFILLYYFHLTNFFWMLVEGLYLYVLVIQTFIAERVKFRMYCLIGWGIPSLVVTSWFITKWLITVPTSENVTSPMLDADLKILNCPWFHADNCDWIYKASALLVLAANMLFLLQIMWVLITKLRSATTPETQQSRKAAKALVVLMPLLGITYVLVLIGPQKTPSYEHIRAFLISTQGFFVALLYCFLNNEVRLQVRVRWNRIRNMGPDWACCGCELDRRQQMQQMRDWSPRSRTESIRLCAANTDGYRKRESSASETTTVTGVVSSFHGNGNNGSQQGIPLCSRKVSSTIPLQSNPLFEIQDMRCEL